MRHKKYVTSSELVEMYKMGFCFRCISKFYERDGDLPSTEMCNECIEMVLSSLNE
jgi:hypothetical protein